MNMTAIKRVSNKKYDRDYETVETIGQPIYTGVVDDSDVFTEALEDMERLLVIRKI